MLKKIYLVKREVIATSIHQAMRKRGRIYEIIECEKEPPIAKKPNKIGFYVSKNHSN